MSIKYYGIYVAYAPTVDLRDQGLGRYLSSFLKGAVGRSDVFFIIACPSWSRPTLEQLFKSEGITNTNFKIIAPKSKPYLVSLYEFSKSFKKKTKNAGKLYRFYRNQIKPKFDLFINQAIKSIVSVNSLLSLVKLLLNPKFWLFIASIVLSPLILIMSFLKQIYIYKNRYADERANAGRKSIFDKYFKKHVKTSTSTSTSTTRTNLNGVVKNPKDSNLVFRLFKQMEENESQLMQRLIDQEKQITAWYCPTAFWPQFNNIRAPKLMCVPDIVLTDFPIGFSEIGNNRFLANFESVETAIYNGEHYVTYSDNVKWNSLVDRYSIRPNQINVIRHAPNDLSQWINSSDGSETVSKTYCRHLIKSVFSRSLAKYLAYFQNDSVSYIFYASQFRPNKNVISLLKAYEYLLRKKWIKHKLILTGKPNSLIQVREYIAKHNLERDVLCLNGLKIEELAAFYKMATLVVNPSLSEGGCPFTFTEALSVNTPVVMARIPVAEEVLTDPELQKVTFFDPYDWKDMALHIEWALEHRMELLAIQKKAYTELAKRSWVDVVDEHIQVLERISSVEAQSELVTES